MGLSFPGDETMNTDRAGCRFSRVAIRLLLVVFLSVCPAARLAAEYRLFRGDVHTHTLQGHITSIPPESSEDREARHKRIAQRRSGPIVIVHRGAWAFAPENTLEAYAAAMDHGADGCEVDIRRTADGVLVMFHDDGLERMTDAFGPSNQYAYAELLAVKFRSVYGAKPDTRIPPLAAVLELARERAMLLHLDVKEPGLEEDIARLLDAADVWDHIVEINEGNATALRKNPHAHRLAYKAFEEATRAFLCRPVATEELEQLLRSTNSAVRGTTILVCLDDRTVSHTSSLEKIMPWTRELPQAGK